MKSGHLGLCAIVALTFPAGTASGTPRLGVKLGNSDGLVAAGVVTLVSDLALICTTVGATVKNGSAIAERRQASRGWRAAGFVLGGVAFPFGVLLTAASIGGIANERAGSASTAQRVVLALGLVHLALGATSITLAALSGRQPEAREAASSALSVAPYVAPTGSGDALYGLALARRF